jgi:hypothetical protein
MKKLIPIISLFLLIFGCGGDENVPAQRSTEGSVGLTVEYTAPEPLAIPESKTPKSENDWETLVHNKEIEVLQVINIINPVAAYITAGFEQYGERIKDNTLNEEWEDTQAQLTSALKLYDSCKERKQAGNFDKKLFLDMENTWQLLVKTGVAGVRTKQMLDAGIKKL